LVSGVALAGAAFGQPVYELAYQFNDEPEVVRAEGEAFSVFAEANGVVDPHWQMIDLGFPFATDRRLGLVAVTGDIFRQRDPVADILTRGRSSVTFDDLVFTSDGTDPITIDLDISVGGNTIYVPPRPDAVGIESILDLEVEIEGDVRSGQIRVLFDGEGQQSVEYSGFLSGIAPDRHALIEGLVVPVNTPVSLRFELTRTLLVPPGSSRFRLAHLPPRLGSPAPGLPIGRSVFIVPDGVAVNSPQAGIRDNRFVVCVADLDADGELTIFDFLAFQNLFDAGDPTADFDGDGTLTLFDFLAFQNAFDAGCP
jgi:hypothetical protein